MFYKIIDPKIQLHPTIDDFQFTGVVRFDKFHEMRINIAIDTDDADISDESACMEYLFLRLRLMFMDADKDELDDLAGDIYEDVSEFVKDYLTENPQHPAKCTLQ